MHILLYHSYYGGKMFNFFNEIKNKGQLNNPEFLNDYNIVNMSGKLLYVEGHKGVTVISKEVIAFKVKKGRVVVEGKDFIVKESFKLLSVFFINIAIPITPLKIVC